MTPTLSVVELLAEMGTAIAKAFPAEVWVRGEVSEFRRTHRGAAFFRLVDPESSTHSVQVGARGALMRDVDRSLELAGVGSLRSGIEIRLKGTVGLRQGSSIIQLSLLEVDPAFTAGRLAIDRAAILRRLAADGTLARNGRLPLPMVPLQIGLVTSRGSAAHADFLDQLRRPGYRFAVRTVQARMQGEDSAAQVAAALDRLSSEPVDLIAVVRGGGSKLDLAAFDAEEVGRAIARMPVPVITGIGHETDRSVADEAAAVAVKTPSAAAEWIVTQVADYARRIETARQLIRSQAWETWNTASLRLDRVASQVAETRGALARQRDTLDHLGSAIAEASRAAVRRRGEELETLERMVEAIGIEPTLRRGFAVVSRLDGSVVRQAGSLTPGDRVLVRMADGTAAMTVEGVT